MAIALVTTSLAGTVPASAAPESRWSAEQPLGGVFDQVEATSDGRVVAMSTSTSAGTVTLRVQTDLVWSPAETFDVNGDSISPTLVRATLHEAGGTVYVSGSILRLGILEVSGWRLDGTDWVAIPALPLGPGAWMVSTASGADGSIVAAWNVNPYTPATASSHTARFDGVEWSDPEPLLPAGVSVGALRIAVASNGAMAAAVHLGGGIPAELVGLTNDGSGWSAPTSLAPASARPTIRGLAMSSDGEAVLVYDYEVPGGGFVQKPIAARSTSGGVWSSAQLLPLGDVPTTMDLEPGRDGEVLLVARVRTFDAQGHLETIDLFTHDGGTWTGPEQLIGLYDITMGPGIDVSVGLDGTVGVATEIGSHPDAPGPDTLIAATARAPGKRWTPAVVVNDVTHVSEPAVAVGSDGVVHHTWRSTNGGTFSRSGIVVEASPFSDVPDDVYFTEAVIWAENVGLTTGVGGTDQFQPHRNITRAETITTLWRLAGAPTGAPPSGFSDVPPNTFYSLAVAWARDAGLTTGVGGTNQFQPNRDITRAEVITLLWRIADMPAGSPPSGFSDVPAGAFYAPAVDWARAQGLTTGVGGTNQFQPNRNITRAETFTLVYRYADVAGLLPSGVGLTSVAAEHVTGARLRPLTTGSRDLGPR